MILSRILQLLKSSALSFYDNGNFTYASSIAFYFLLSIIPFVSLTIIIVNSFQAYFQVDYVQILAPHISNMFPFVTEEKISALINIQTVTKSNIIGLLVLPVVSGFIFSVMDNAYRKIFKLPFRHLIFSQMVYPIVSVSVIILLFFANIFFSILSSYMHVITKYVPELSYVWDYLPSINSHVVSSIIFLVFYILLINLFVGLDHSIKLKYKLMCAALFYALWYFAKIGFTYYLQINTNMSLIYGPLTSIIVILLWVYYSTLVLLFTLEVLHYLHVNFENNKSAEALLEN